MKNILILLVSLVLHGCANNSVLAPEAKSVFQELKQQKIAVKSEFCVDNINYREGLYRVFWIEENKSSLDFTGIWDSSSADLTRYAVDTLRNQGYDARGVYELVPDGKIIEKENNALVPLCKKYSVKIKTSIGWGWFLPPQSFFNIENISEFETLSDSLKQQNYKYFIEITSPGLNASSGIISTFVAMSQNIRLIDLTRNKVISSFSVYPLTSDHGSRDLRDLETNNMSKLKQMLKTIVEKINFEKQYNPDR